MVILFSLNSIFKLDASDAFG